MRGLADRASCAARACDPREAPAGRRRLQRAPCSVARHDRLDPEPGAGEVVTTPELAIKATDHLRQPGSTWPHALADRRSQAIMEQPELLDVATIKNVGPDRRDAQIAQSCERSQVLQPPSRY